MENYFDKLSLKEQQSQLRKCDFMNSSEFKNGVTALNGKKVLIIGCGAQCLNQVANKKFIKVNQALRNNPIDIVGATLRASMTAMQNLN